ncbi:MAG: hypothetical protein JWO38_381 [Gemmataceae bacterium]|nr:hypothetical protein [Gemmataceae bacterium]
MRALRALRAERPLVGGLVWCLVSSLAVHATGSAQPPPKNDPPEEPKKLNEAIEKSVNWYDVLPEEGATPLTPVPVIRWRNVVRGQEGEAMMVVWSHNGRPVAMASIYPWEGKMTHEFDSLSHGAKLIARDKDRVIWAPETAGVEFKAVPKAPQPAKTAPERLRQMKTITEGFKATMTGWQADNSDQESLRLLPRPLHRYDLANAKDPDPKLLDGALFAYVQGTDPEVVLVLEAVGTADQAEWQCAFVRATSGGLEVKSGDEVVWTAQKHPANRNPKLPHFSMQRVLEK